MLPSVTIDFANGALGAVAPNADGVAGLIVNGTEAGDLSYDSCKVIYSVDDLLKLGCCDGSDNSALLQHVRDFYAQAGNGAELWIRISAGSSKPSDVLKPDEKFNPHDIQGGEAYDMLSAAKGRIRFFGVVNTNADFPDLETYDLPVAVANGQAVCERATRDLYAPCFCLVQGRSIDQYSIQHVQDMSRYNANRVAVVVGSSQAYSVDASVGLVLGRLAKNPVHRHIGRVRDGAISLADMYLSADRFDNSIAARLHDLGLLTFCQYVGRVGWYVADDCLATAVDDDYRSIARRRTADKAYRIIYATLANHIFDEIPVTSTGSIVPTMAKAWESEVIAAIASAMTVNGELGTDPADDSDQGVKCFIDPNQNILADNTVRVRVQVKPYGYAKYINVELGFTTNQNN